MEGVEQHPSRRHSCRSQQDGPLPTPPGYSVYAPATLMAFCVHQRVSLVSWERLKVLSGHDEDGLMPALIRSRIS